MIGPWGLELQTLYDLRHFFWTSWEAPGNGMVERVRKTWIERQAGSDELNSEMARAPRQPGLVLDLLWIRRN